MFYDLKKGCQHFIRQGLLRLIIRDTSHHIQLSNTFLVFKPCLILLVSHTTIMNSQQWNSLILNSMKQLISKKLISDFIKSNTLHQTSIILYSLFQYTCNRHSFNFIDKVRKIFSLNIVQLIYDKTNYIKQDGRPLFHSFTVSYNRSWRRF